MNKTVLSRLKSAINRNLNEKAGQIIESGGTYLSKRSIKQLIRYMHKRSTYPYNVVSYIYYVSPLRHKFDPAANQNILIQNVILVGSDLALIRLLLADPRVDIHDKYDYVLGGFTSDTEIDVLKLLLEYIDPAELNNILLRRACSCGNIGLVKLLLADDRVDPSAYNNGAIILASGRGHVEIIKLLLARTEVDPSCRDNCALKSACCDNRHDAVRILLDDERVDPTADENRAIHYAISLNHIEIIQTLLDDGRIDPAEKNNRILNNAVWDDKTGVVEALLKDPRVLAGPLRFAISTAEIRGCGWVVDFIKSHQTAQVC